MKRFLLLLNICWSISMQGQQFNVNLTSPGSIKNSISPFKRYGKKLYTHEMEYTKSQAPYLTNFKKVQYKLELTQYDETFKELKKLSIDKGEKDLGPLSPVVHYGATAIYVLYSRFADDNKIKMYVAKVNPDNLSVITTKEVMEHDQKNQDFWRVLKRMEQSTILFTASADGKNMWIVQVSPTQVISTVIDDKLNVIQQSEPLPGKMENIQVTGTYIGNEGNKVLVCRYYSDDKNKDYDRAVFFQPANTKWVSKLINLPDGFSLGYLSVQESRTRTKLYFGAEYFAKKHDEGNRGVLLGEINIASQSISNPAIHPYTDELKQRILDLDFASRKNGEIVFLGRGIGYKITEMENGTIVLSGDMHTSASTTNGTTFYYVGPVIHVFIIPNGKANMTLIPKKQANDPVTEFFNYVYKDKLICVYADIPKFQQKELKDKQIGLVRRVVEMVPVANVYDSDGKLLERKMLIDSPKKIKGNVMLGGRSKLADNLFIFPVGKSKVNLMGYYTDVNEFCYLEIL